MVIETAIRILSVILPLFLIIIFLSFFFSLPVISISGTIKFRCSSEVACLWSPARAWPLSETRKITRDVFLLYNFHVCPNYLSFFPPMFISSHDATLRISAADNFRENFRPFAMSSGAAQFDFYVIS